jgi:hypothetical protein
LDLDHQEAGEVGTDPLFVEGVGLLLLDAVVAVDPKTLRVLALEVGVGRFGAEIADVFWKVAVKNHQRIARLRMLVVAVRQEHVGAEKHRPSPELGQQFALNADVPDVLGVRRWLDGWNDLVELDSDDRVPFRVEVDLPRRAVVIARGAIPLLPLSAVHRQLHRVTVSAVECFVPMEHGLQPVRARRHVAEALDRIADDRSINDDRFSGCQAIDANAEDLDRLHTGPDLEAGLVVRVRGQHEDDLSIDRLDRLLRLEVHLELHRLDSSREQHGDCAKPYRSQSSLHDHPPVLWARSNFVTEPHSL